MRIFNLSAAPRNQRMGSKGTPSHIPLNFVAAVDCTEFAELLFRKYRS